MSRARDLASLMSQGNLLQDGVISTTEVDGVTATSAELNKLDGVTANTAELNTLAGITANTAELNKLDGVTASTTEINKLTGLTASTVEINRLTGVTSDVQTQINTKAATASLAAVATSGAASDVSGLGTAATLNVGTGANNIQQLDSNGKLGAIDGSQLTGVSAFSFASTLAFE